MLADQRSHFAVVCLEGDTPGCGDHESEAKTDRGRPQGRDAGFAPGAHSLYLYVYCTTDGTQC